MRRALLAAFFALSTVAAQAQNIGPAPGGGGGSSSLTVGTTAVSGGGASCLLIGSTALSCKTAGTGVLTALGVNIGSAGAPVLFNGAGGTPSSLTLTNATGLAIAGTTGWGTGVATALAINVGSAGAFVTYGGALGTPSSGTLTNASGLPISGIASLGTGVSTALGNATNAASGLVALDSNQSLSITGATVTTSAPVLNLSQTWNASGTTFTGLKFNVTNTASASGSLLADFQVGGTSLLSIKKDGRILGPDGGVGSTQIAYAFQSDATSGLYRNNTIGFVGFFQGNQKIISWSYATGFTFVNGMSLNWSSTSSSEGTVQTYVTSPTTATLQLGAADAASPVAQTLQVQNVVAGTSNTAGANLTINGSRGTGTGAGGSLVFQVAPAGTTGSTQNALVAGLTVAPGGLSSLGLGASAGAQRFNIYSAFSSTSNYARAYIDAGQTTANVLAIGSEHNTDTTDAMTTLKLNVDGTTIGTLTGSLTTFATAVKTLSTTVSSLPSASTAGAGARAAVTDSTACTFGGTLTGGGSTYCPVTSDGSAWHGG